MNNKFEALAMNLFFEGAFTPEMMKKHGVELKEGKERADVIRAYNKGCIAGRGKFEREAMMAGKEIAKVCK
jgi:hypothetical protein